MKYTVEVLQSLGYKGYQYNTMTGNRIEARYPLDEIAWCANNKPERLQFTNDDIGGMVRVHICNTGYWTPPTNIVKLAERPMREDELYQAGLRLQALGVSVSGGGARK